MKNIQGEIVSCFDTFTKLSLRNCLYDIRKKKEKLANNEQPFTVGDIFEFTMDAYDIEENYINILDFDLMIKNDLLFESLKQLEKNQRDIIYLSVCREWSDKEIGEYMNMSRQKVQRIKVKVLNSLRKNMVGDDDNGC